MNQEISVVVAALIKRGKHRGFLTMAEVQQELEDAEAPGEAFEEVADALRAKGIKLTEEGPGATEEFIEVGAISVSDPVRLYLNEIGRYSLLTAQQEVELAIGFHDDDACPGLDAVRPDSGLGSFGGQLGEELVGGDAHRAPQAGLLQDPAPQPAGDLRPVAEQAAGTPDVEEGLVEGDGLDQRRDLREDPVDLGRDLPVAGVVAGHEQQRALLTSKNPIGQCRTR